MASNVQVGRIVVRPGRLICDIRVPDTALRVAPAELVEEAVLQYPSLPHHSCVNEVGPTFADVMGSTSLPHLIEHIAIDAQTRRSRDRQASFVGTSEWLDEASGRARIELSFSDDLEAMRALNEALDFVNAFNMGR